MCEHYTTDRRLSLELFLWRRGPSRNRCSHALSDAECATFAIVTGASHEYFERAKNLVGSVHVWDPALPVPLMSSEVHVKRFRRVLVFKTRRLLYHSTLGSRALKNEKTRGLCPRLGPRAAGTAPSTLNPDLFFFFLTFEPRVERYNNLCDLNTSPPRNCSTFLLSSS